MMALTIEEEERVQVLAAHAARGAMTAVLLEEKMHKLLADRVGAKLPAAGNHFRFKVPGLGEIDFTGRDVIHGMTLIVLAAALGALVMFGRQDMVLLRQAVASTASDLQTTLGERQTAAINQHHDIADRVEALIYVYLAPEAKRQKILERMEEPTFFRPRVMAPIAAPPR